MCVLVCVQFRLNCTSHFVIFVTIQIIQRFMNAYVSVDVLVSQMENGAMGPIKARELSSLGLVLNIEVG